MRLLVLALCVQSLLQVPPLVLAKPDFGINLMITGSAKVSSATSRAGTVMMAVDDNTPFTADTNYASLQPLADLMTDVASMTLLLGSELVPLASSLVTDVSGNVPAAFKVVLDKITELKGTIGSLLPTKNTAIRALIGDYVPKQLTDGFNRIVPGLDDLTRKLQALQGAVELAITQAGSIADLTDALVKKNVKPTLMYDTVFTINQLGAFVPVVKYTIDSTLENINLADDYLLLVYDSMSNITTTPSNSSASIAPVQAITDAIRSGVKADLDGFSSDFATLKTAVNGLTNVASSPDFSTVSSALDAFSTQFARLASTHYPALDGYISALLAAMATTPSGSVSTPTEISSDMLDSLILTVIENGKFAQFCFYKYYELVLGTLLASTGNAATSNGLSACIDKEVTRLATLQDTLILATALLPFDYTDILDELTLCDTLTDSTDLHDCLTTFAGYYTNVAVQFGNKLQEIFDLIGAETVACANRYLICIELSSGSTVTIDNSAISDTIRQCALGGPTADD